MRQGKVFFKDDFAGIITETNDGEYTFQYDPEYITNFPGQSITFSMPVSGEIYKERRLFPFFEGLIPEGWLLDIASNSWKINKNDRVTICRNGWHTKQFCPAQPAYD